MSLLLTASSVVALDAREADTLLQRADTLKTSSYAEFVAIVDTLEGQARELTPSQHDHLRFLRGWQIAYEGNYEAGIAELRRITGESSETNLTFRARATIVNLLSISRRYDEVFYELNRLLEQLPYVTAEPAREQGIAVVALLYNQVGQYELGLRYAEELLKGASSARGVCIGGQLRLEALFHLRRLRAGSQQFIEGIDACSSAREALYANLVRTYAARMYAAEARHDSAIQLLEAHYDDVQRTRYARLIAEFDSLLADLHRAKGDVELARDFALRAIENGVKDHLTEPLITAYRLLYELARERGDVRAALEYHEKYAAADKGYLDDVSARQLAYERVRHQTEATSLQVEALNQQNQLLQLERENARLYIVLLVLVVGFIGFWAYRTKRSQLHFMRLARVDSLTGIANRPHFLEQAERALEGSRRLSQETSVVLCDLDFFKSINDQYGHATGDFVLKQVVQACGRHLRPGDVFGRFGGEEFGIVLPGCGPETARERCEQLRAAIADVAVHPGSMVSQVSASFGIASTAVSGHELRQLLAHADAALYRAKDAGRNRVVVYSAIVTHVGNLPACEAG